jgi:hypothetical protein
LAILTSGAVAVSFGPFPYQDSINHLARYALMERAWFGEPAPWTIVRATPTPYAGLDLVGVVLVHILGPVATLRVMALLALAMLPIGMYLLLQVTAPAQRGWALVGVLCGFSRWYLGGNSNFWTGLGILCIALALWWTHRETSTWSTRVLLATIPVLLLLIHLFSALMFLVVVWVDLCWHAAARWRGLEGARPVSSRVVTVFMLSSAFGLLFLWMEPAEAVVSPHLASRELWGKVLNLADMFYALGFLQFAVGFAGYVFAVISYVRHNRWAYVVNPFLLSAPVFLGLYLVSPGTWDLDVRWLPAAYILPFCAPSRDRPPPRRVLFVLLGFCMAHALVVGVYAGRIHGQLQAFDVALDRLPRDARLLPLVTETRRLRVRPYLHYALWHTIRTSSQVGGLFSRRGAREGDPTYPHFAHFDLQRSLYFPLYGWAIQSYEPLDCRRVRRDYDYVVQAGPDPKAGRLISRCARPVFTLQDITIYRVMPGDAGEAGN